MHIWGEIFACNVNLFFPRRKGNVKISASSEPFASVADLVEVWRSLHTMLFPSFVLAHRGGMRHLFRTWETAIRLWRTQPVTYHIVVRRPWKPNVTLLKNWCSLFVCSGTSRSVYVCWSCSWFGFLQGRKRIFNLELQLLEERSHRCFHSCRRRSPNGLVFFRGVVVSRRLRTS